MSKNPIFIPLRDYHYQGGVESFMRNLERYLRKIGYEYLDDPKDAKVIFFPITFDQAVLTEIKSKGGRVIQRLAGGFYPSQHGEAYTELNRPISEVYSNYTDFVVFQSEYGRKQDFEIFGTKPEGQYTTIINGVDKSIFYPAQNRTPNAKKIFVSTGSFRKKVMLVPAIEALDSLAEKYEFEYWVIGEVTMAELKPYLDRPYVKYTDKLPLTELAEKLRQADALIHTQLNDICPNSVTEAISSGLPVIGFASGSLPELLAFDTDLLAYVSEDLLQKAEDFDSHKLAEKIELYFSDSARFDELAKQNAQLYPFDECGAAYVEVFNHQIQLAK